MANLKLVSPWINYYHEVNVFFDGDRDVHVIFDEDNFVLKLYVDDPAKADALSEIMPIEKIFGNTSIKIEVIPSNEGVLKSHFNSEAQDYTATIFINALAGNKVFDEVEKIDGIVGFAATYVIFKRGVIQYYNDDIGSYYGVKSMLAEDIARDIFKEIPGVFFCTTTRTYNTIPRARYHEENCCCEKG